ncbi:hypothetical protein [Hymenobacter sp. CRA2]|uniref:hypothetical protein n=1 Tax=Hymenobacter sp. CRA2 TaxID=1955620 RepID=UPI00098F2BFD|nr:hypothetical protein [Hymenobacter sp. CRA2]OON67294.1 hypothetical protein B0919_19460 [Hymenobacter sp. CRA2]
MTFPLRFAGLSAWALAVVSCSSPSESVPTEAPAASSPQVALMSPRRSEGYPDTVRAGQPYVRKVFFNYGYFRAVAAGSSYPYSVKATSYFRDNPKLQAPTRLVGDTCYVDLSPLVQGLRWQHQPSFTWLCTFEVDYKPEPQGADTVFAVSDQVFVK